MDLITIVHLSWEIRDHLQRMKSQFSEISLEDPLCSLGLRGLQRLSTCRALREYVHILPHLVRAYTAHPVSYPLTHYLLHAYLLTNPWSGSAVLLSVIGYALLLRSNDWVW